MEVSIPVVQMQGSGRGDMEVGVIYPESRCRAVVEGLS